MDIKEVYKSLCYYDERHPDGYNTPEMEWLRDNDDEITPPRNNCSCDNCFYGRDELALEIIRLRNLVQ